MGRHKGDGCKYTRTVSEEICRRLAEGEGLNSICKDEGMPKRTTVLNWLSDERDDFPDRYARARENGYDVMAEQIIEIADDSRNDWMEKHHYAGDDTKAFNGEHVQRSKLRVDSRKWLLSKMLPKRYGDRLEVTGSGAGLQPILNVAISAPGAAVALEGQTIEGEAAQGVQEQKRLKSEAEGGTGGPARPDEDRGDQD